MEKFKTFLKIMVSPVFFVVLFPTCISATDTISVTNYTILNENLACFREVIPIQYEINIGPVKNSSDPVRVSCWVKIKAKIIENGCQSTNNSETLIKLNTRNCKLDLKNLTVTTAMGQQSSLLAVKNDSIDNSASSQIILQLKESETNIGEQILLHMPYEIELKRDYQTGTYEGFYYYDPTTNNDTDNVPFYFPLHARHMFPIIENSNTFNKPTLKFSVVRNYPNNFVSVSNTDLVETVEFPEFSEGWVTDHFRESPPMNSNQVTLFVLRGFHNHTIIMENVNSNNDSRAINIWTIENAEIKNETIYHTLFEVQRFMNYFDEMFKELKYPLNKIDFIGVPWITDSMSWQAANLGIVIKKHKGMFLQPDGYKDEWRMNRDNYELLASYVALQWFRGISSPTNEYSHDEMSGESLAFYVNRWVLNYPPETLPVYMGENRALPIDMPSLLNMMENLFSRTILQYAICQIYLPKTIHDGTFPKNLWSAIEQSIEFHNKTDLLPSNGENETVKLADIFHSWITNATQYPRIVINEIKNETDSIEIYQKCIPNANDDKQTCWWIPVKILSGNKSVLIWISPNNTSVNSSKIYQNSDLIDTENGWIFVNAELTRYYDVQYSENLMKNMVRQLELNHLVFSAYGRQELLNKQFTVASKDSKWNTLELALEMTKYLGREMESDVWGNVIYYISRFVGKFLEQPSDFQIYFGDKINQILREIGLVPLANEDSSIAELRLLLMKSSHFYEVPIISEYSLDLMSKWKENITVNPFHPIHDIEIRQTAYCSAVRSSSDSSNYNFLYDYLLNSNVTNDLNDKYDVEIMCKALACVRNDDILGNLLRNDSKLATTINQKELQICYQQYIPFEILWRRPKTMKEAVYKFLARFDLQENRKPVNDTVQVKMLIPWNYKVQTDMRPSGFLESIPYTSLRDHINLFPDDYLENRKESKRWITWLPNKESDELEGILLKSKHWFKTQLEISNK